MMSAEEVAGKTEGGRSADISLRWYPTAAAIAEYLYDTWTSLPGSQSVIHDDESLWRP